MSTYKYTVTGRGSNDTWATSGTLEATPANFPLLWNKALTETFDKLTKGQAIYGHPGEGGCRGPYQIITFTLALVEDET